MKDLKNVAHLSYASSKDVEKGEKKTFVFHIKNYDLYYSTSNAFLRKYRLYLFRLELYIT